MAKSKYPHIEWLDLQKDGVLVEVAILRRDTLGNIYFIRLDVLDSIDKKRLSKIVTNRNAELYELWDLMSNVTLGNGMNSLEYFHQLVKVVTPSGVIMNPTSGSMGAPTKMAAPIVLADDAPVAPAAAAPEGVTGTADVAAPTA